MAGYWGWKLLPTPWILLPKFSHLLAVICLGFFRTLGLLIVKAGITKDWMISCLHLQGLIQSPAHKVSGNGGGGVGAVNSLLGGRHAWKEECFNLDSWGEGRLLRSCTVRVWTHRKQQAKRCQETGSFKILNKSAPTLLWLKQYYIYKYQDVVLLSDFCWHFNLLSYTPGHQVAHPFCLFRPSPATTFHLP